MLARLIANFHRRQVSREEKEEWINGLAKIYQKQGLKVISVTNDGKHNEIKQKIMEVTGLSDFTVDGYLHNEFKQEPREGVGRKPEPLLEKAEKALGEEGLKKLDCNTRIEGRSHSERWYRKLPTGRVACSLMQHM